MGFRNQGQSSTHPMPKWSYLEPLKGGDIFSRPVCGRRRSLHTEPLKQGDFFPRPLCGRRRSLPQVGVSGRRRSLLQDGDSTCRSPQPRRSVHAETMHSPASSLHAFTDRDILLATRMWMRHRRHSAIPHSSPAASTSTGTEPPLPSSDQTPKPGREDHDHLLAMRMWTRRTRRSPPSEPKLMSTF